MSGAKRGDENALHERLVVLQIRYHPKFKVSTDTLLFAGSRDEIDLLRSFFLVWNGEQVDLIGYLQGKTKVYLFAVSSFQLRRDTSDAFTWRKDKGTWLISSEHQQTLIGLLDGLLNANDEGHQYLDDGTGPVQIMVSKDENYPLPPPATP